MSIYSWLNIIIAQLKGYNIGIYLIQYIKSIIKNLIQIIMIKPIEPEEHFPLDTVLEVTFSHSAMDNFVNGFLRESLASEVTDDGFLLNLCPDREPSLDLLLNLNHLLVIFLGGKSFRSRQVTSCRRCQCRHRKQQNGFLYMFIRGKWFQLHF